MSMPVGDGGPGVVDRFLIWLMPRITPGHVWMYRKLGGKFVNRTAAGGPVLLLTTMGRRSGEQRTVALGYLDEGGCVYVVGSNGGRPYEPAWMLNLRAAPSVEVQIGRERFSVEAELLGGEDREQVWQRYVAAYPSYQEAERWADRQFAVVRLRRPIQGSSS